MAYDLYCKECGALISPQQYDAYLGLCAECVADEIELSDDPAPYELGNPISVPPSNYPNDYEPPYDWDQSTGLETD